MGLNEAFDLIDQLFRKTDATITVCHILHQCNIDKVQTQNIRLVVWMQYKRNGQKFASLQNLYVLMSNPYSIGVVLPKGSYRGISLPTKVIEAIEQFIADNPEAGYTSIADFVSDATRLRFAELGIYPGQLTLLEINSNEKGPLMYDRTLKNTVQVFIGPSGINCGECQKESCRHVSFALKKSDVRELIRRHRKEGWKLPDV